MFKKTEFEKFLVKNWTEFLDIRKTIEFVKTMARKKLKINDPKIINLSVSNCFFSESGITLWIDYNVANSVEKVNLTTEILISHNNIKNIKTI